MMTEVYQRGYGALRITPFDADQVDDLRSHMTNTANLLRVDGEKGALCFEHDGIEDLRDHLFFLESDVRRLVEAASEAGLVVSGEMHRVGPYEAELMSVSKNVVTVHQGQIMARYGNGVSLPITAA